MIDCSHLFTWSFCLIFMVGSAASLSGPAHFTSSETEVHACVHVVCACAHAYEGSAESQVIGEMPSWSHPKEG